MPAQQQPSARMLHSQYPARMFGAVKQRGCAHYQPPSTPQLVINSSRRIGGVSARGNINTYASYPQNFQMVPAYPGPEPNSWVRQPPPVMISEPHNTSFTIQPPFVPHGVFGVSPPPLAFPSPPVPWTQNGTTYYDVGQSYYQIQQQGFRDDTNWSPPQQPNVEFLNCDPVVPSSQTHVQEFPSSQVMLDSYKTVPPVVTQQLPVLTQQLPVLAQQPPMCEQVTNNKSNKANKNTGTPHSDRECTHHVSPKNLQQVPLTKTDSGTVSQKKEKNTSTPYFEHGGTQQEPTQNLNQAPQTVTKTDSGMTAPKEKNSVLSSDRKGTQCVPTKILVKVPQTVITTDNGLKDQKTEKNSGILPSTCESTQSATPAKNLDQVQQKVIIINNGLIHQKTENNNNLPAAPEILPDLAKLNIENSISGHQVEQQSSDQQIKIENKSVECTGDQ